MNFDDKPTAESIASLRQHLMKVWGNTWGDWEKRDSYYFRNFELWPAGMLRPVYYPARPTQIVDAAVDHQMGFEPKPHRYETGEGEEKKEKATSVENYVRAVFAQTALMEPTLTGKAAAKNLIHLGYTVVEGPMLSYQGRPKKPEQKRGEPDDDYRIKLALYENEKKTWMPFRIRVPHPARVLLDPLERNPVFAIRHAVRYSHELQTMTQARKGRRRDVDLWEVGDNPWELIMCDEYWTKEWHAVVANTDVSGASGNRSKGGDPDRAVIVEKNTWGFVPYGHAFAGWGQIPTSDPNNDPLYLASGILSSVMDDLKLDAQAAAGRHNALIEATFALKGTTGDAAEVNANLAKGDIIPLPDKSALWYLDIPNLPQWLFETQKLLAQDIEAATMSRSLAGIHQPGINTLGEEVLLSTAAGRKFIAANKQLEHVFTVIASNILRLVDVLDETLYCRGKTIRPSDIDHDYAIEVTFEVPNLPLQLQLREMGLKERAQGDKSQATYWLEDAGREDGTDERRRLLEDAVRAHPAVHEAMAMDVARDMGVGDILERWNAAQAAGAGGNGGGGNPAKPPQLMGPDGMPVLGGSLGQPPVEQPVMNGLLGGRE